MYWIAVNSKYLVLFVITICATVKFFRHKKTDTSPSNLAYWSLLLISMSSMLLYLEVFEIRRALIMSLMPIGFILMAIAALTEKRICAVIGAVYFAAVVVFERLIDGLILLDSVVAIYCLILAFMVIRKYTQPKTISSFDWIILIALPVLLIAGFLTNPYSLLDSIGIILSLFAAIYWLSPKTEWKSQKSKVIKTNTQPELSLDDMDQRLKTLETLQELLNNSVITQEEFDEKKKQLLGL